MKKNNISIYFFLLIVLFLPWFNGNYFDSINLDSTEPNMIEPFFQINTCKISYFEYILHSEELKEVKFHVDDSSPIYCFGRISQYISNEGNIDVYVGTNFFVNILINLFIIVFLIKIISRDSDKLNKVSMKVLFQALVFISLLIFSDRKFYAENFYLLDTSSFSTYLFIFCFVFLLLFFVNDNMYIKNNYLINYLPFMFLFPKNISQTNVSIFLIYFTLLGIQENVPRKRYLVIRNLYIFGIIFWSLNARIVYIDYPLNYLGFTSTSYDFYSIIFYSFIFFFVLKGIFNFKSYGFKKISLDKLIKNLYSVFLIKIFIYCLSIYSTANFVLSNYFAVSIKKSDEVILYNFLNNNIDFLILLLFFSVIKFLSDKNQNKINLFSSFYVVLFLLNSSSFYKIYNSNFVESNIKFFELYNPTFLELLIGSGPLNFNQFNFENNSNYIFDNFNTVTSLLLFFGAVGMVLAITYLFYLIKINFNFSVIFVIQLLFLIYLFFSGVINNISSLANFYILFSILFNRKLNFQFLKR